jgi:hypothetical protein
VRVTYGKLRSGASRWSQEFEREGTTQVGETERTKGARAGDRARLVEPLRHRNVDEANVLSELRVSG